MDRRYFFVRLKREILERDLYALEDMGKIERSGLGTAIDPDSVWIVIGTYAVATIAQCRGRIDAVGYGAYVQDIRIVRNPEEGAVMAQQLGLFN